MRKSIHLFISLILIYGISSSCVKNKDILYMNINFIALFDNDNIKVYMDDQLIYNNNLTTVTNAGITTSGSHTNSLAEGKHVFKFVVNDIYEKSIDVKIEKDSYMLLYYEPMSHNITYEISTTPFLFF